MCSTRFPVVSALALGMTLCISPSSYAAGISFSCDVGGLRIGAVSGAPFTADMVQGRWEILPDGRRKLMPLKEGEAMPPGGNPNLVRRVARDSEGRVLVENLEYNPANASETPEPEGWSSATICDPIAGTTTTLTRAIAVKDAKDLLTGMHAQTNAGIDGTAKVRPWTNRRIGGFGASVYGRVEHLGVERVDGVSSERIRLLGSVKSEGLRDECMEFLVSEEIEAELSTMFVNTAENMEDGIKLIHLKRVEPDAEIYPFKIPAGFAANSSEDKEAPMSKAHGSCPVH